jgi:predicted transcriptional regulator
VHVTPRAATVRNMSRDRQDRVTIPEAASRLGITQAAVRQRIRRGSISWEKGEDRRTYVYISPDVTARHTVDETSRDELIEELRDRIRYLEEESSRKDHLLAAALERIPAIEAPQEPRESPESAEPRSDRGTTPEEQEEQTARPWWRRMFGG